MELFVKLQVPTIELEVNVKDAAGTKDKIIVGFNRYEIEESKTKFAELERIAEESEVKIQENLYMSFVKNEVVYLRKMELESKNQETGKMSKLLVEDTRTQKAIEGLWGTPEQCLDVLLDYYLRSAPYRLSFISTMSTAIANLDHTENKIKN